ncbi:uncharacterized protein LOC111327703 [Stylophora pistillata]|uniref:uncharacterized protein LOC111327703 n=1 Tax=Stylophora pistillata TaxID=50429 RepID=UPI000C0568A8|nr:uncharacterized protein LOC111327703 [Stylophora pistillata]
MYKLVLGLFLITFQVGCHGAPGLKMKLKHVVKRAVCTKDQLEEDSSCAHWKESGYCERQHQYYEYVSARCQKSCGLCEPPPPQGKIKSSLVRYLNRICSREIITQGPSQPMFRLVEQLAFSITKQC